MKYAPVLIPTLNRYEHLRECLESLSRCVGADKTEVFVALDYPPTDNWDLYAPGWEINRKWLRSVGNMGFKKLHLIEREHNYGIWKNGLKNNMSCLVEEVSKKFDIYITSEDDNVFAPCFLEYINKGLEKFEDDPTVLCISGYKSFYSLVSDENTFFFQNVDYNSWGVASWVKKQPVELNYRWWQRHLSFKKLWHVYRCTGAKNMLSILEYSCYKEKPYGLIDRHFSAYMALMDLYQVTPVKRTLVENRGLDGTGNMPDYRGQDWCNPALNPLSEEEHFDYVGTGWEHHEENQRLYREGRNWNMMSPHVVLFATIRKIIKVLLHWNR